ncbi:MAG: MoxR family ATPase, partial [Pseudomonadota bacterium]|nr:MoxR family ATPase [Pseudomonadota bacterium]
QPFHVLATQNPIEQEGTYPLPEAQLDRFLMQIDVGYPDLEAERRMVLVTTGGGEAQVIQVMSGGDLARAQSLLRQVPVGENIIAAILDIVRAGRPEASDLALVRAHVAWGPGPRASQALTMAARARALLYGRLTPSIEDVLALAPPVLRHRMALSFTARAEAVTLAQVIDAMSAKYA